MDAITLHDVTKQFRHGERPALDSISIAVPRGSIFGFLGPNGSGKTTAIRLMLGLLTPTSGTITLLGRFKSPQLDRARRAVGATVETPAFYPYLTAADTIQLCATIRGVAPEVDKLLGLVDLASDVDRPVAEFSLGMKQRLALAVALLGDPELLILDEPTNGLDPRGLRSFGQALLDIADAGATVFISSHILGEVQRICTHVAILSRGCMVHTGPISAMNERACVEIAAVNMDALLSALKGTTFATIVAEKSDMYVVEVAEARLEDLSKSLASLAVYPTLFRPRCGDIEDLFLRLTAE